MIKEIKKGDRFVCVNANTLWEGKFIPGNIYEANDSYSLVDENKKSIWFHPLTGIFELHFIPYNYKSIEKYYRKLPRKSTDDIQIVKIFDEILRKLIDESVTDDFEENNLAWAIGGIKESADGTKVADGYSPLPPYYDNTNGSLYQIAEQRGWNAYTFDVIKRLDRGGKKDPLPLEIQKSIGVLQLWLKELNQ